MRTPLPLLLPFLTLTGCAALLGRAAGVGPGDFVVESVSSELVPTRDGIVLTADVYLPAAHDSSAESRWPTILIRTPYGRGDGKLKLPVLARFFARHGYAVVVQDVRGRFDSGGEWYPFAHEQDDGMDTFAWTRAQPFCDGNIATFGLSYFGFTQWALGVQAPEGLKAMVPMIISTDLRGWFYEGGSFKPDLASTWALSVSDPKANRRTSKRELSRMFRHLPPIEADDAVLADLPWYDEWLTHPEPGSPWDDWLPPDAPSRVKVPVLLVAGWFDIFGSAQIRDYQALAANPDARGSALLVGPWNHYLGLMSHSDMELGEEGDIFGALPLILRWLDHHVKGEGPEPGFGPVRAYEVGAGRWNDYPSWPPPRSEKLVYQLASPDPQASSSTGRSGRLTIAQSGARGGALASRLEFVYDPNHPVPTRGGAAFSPRLSLPQDQSAIEKRQDVLHFSASPLARSIHLAGSVTASLCVSSSAMDTAFTARLLDIDPEGKTVGIMDGIRSLAYRDGDHEARPLEPNQQARLSIPLGEIDWRLETGHALGLDLSSSNFPRFAVHPNLFGPWAETTNRVPARQVVYLGGECPSTLELSVLRDTVR